MFSTRKPKCLNYSYQRKIELWRVLHNSWIALAGYYAKCICARKIDFIKLERKRKGKCKCEAQIGSWKKKQAICRFSFEPSASCELFKTVSACLSRIKLRLKVWQACEGKSSCIKTFRLSVRSAILVKTRARRGASAWQGHCVHLGFKDFAWFSSLKVLQEPCEFIGMVRLWEFKNHRNVSLDPEINDGLNLRFKFCAINNSNKSVAEFSLNTYNHVKLVREFRSCLSLQSRTLKSNNYIWQTNEKICAWWMFQIICRCRRRRVMRSQVLRQASYTDGAQVYSHIKKHRHKFKFSSPTQISPIFALFDKKKKEKSFHISNLVCFHRELCAN